jgi:NEDD8-activating enzyme E1 regulatory subunit
MLASSVPYTLIMHMYPTDHEDLGLLLAYGEHEGIPVVAMHSAGFYSYFQICLPGAFPIVDTHPSEESMSDLRLLSPWPELAAFARDMTANIDDLNDHNHGHLPWIVILLHYLDKWRETHDGKNPSNYAEKVAFRATVRDAARRDNPEGGEENFDEAASAVIKSISPADLPAELKEVFDHGQSMQVCHMAYQ